MGRRVHAKTIRLAIEDAFWLGALHGRVSLPRFGEMLDEYADAIRGEAMRPERAPVLAVDKGAAQSDATAFSVDPISSCTASPSTDGRLSARTGEMER